MNTEKIIIFDTTLRDGEQSPGINLDTAEKVEIALMLEGLKVDVIEAGFAVSSPGEFEAIKAVARVVKDSTICSLSRAVERDIDLTAEAVSGAASSRIHIVLATSPIHMKYKLQMTPENVLEHAVRAVVHARRYSEDIEFSCEDASRSEPEFLARFVEQVIKAGATTVSLPDTVGYSTPHEYGKLFTYLRNVVPNADQAVFSAHCHNDLGMAVSNSLEATRQGARQIECTINGIGERAGNASLEEIVMALHTRADFFRCRTSIETRRLTAASRLVSEITGFVVQPNKAIVGRNAFSHQSGIHQDGMLKNPLTYQIMTAAEVGADEYRLVLGKNSGRNGFRMYMRSLGIEFGSDADLDRAFSRFKDIADQKASLCDEDLLATVVGMEALSREKHIA
ncbi:MULTISPECIES: 2-isopropylmalate synthase [unclassified Rhizobium]|uniref:2-isopropylmalate synthase n=1 Tax=unclassified Rhizobium TaxID=2613769 RepID=UPI000DE05761|nr:MULTISPECIES: 2-isopropylmalate synthase [unclassified Rhizobium]MBB3290863.1 2-isopropylmalate synthase [Rhizobium sp. BK252]MBB3405643.1 2-isopropylmalate synthase [Rhizobium sp. BK289]MBB3418190.1 2-isopropylmalate synthase [Rhizobium sp. BK284]MBB3486128.1 2-isopropylmalate synthase [Rhizobium sp. BK347]MDK4723798.1 2-isopropylmalate synthase [Rhizobium sp. CNPSo 3968]